MTIETPLDWRHWVLSETGAAEIVAVSLIQELWRGYGELLRITLSGGPAPSVILKRVVPPQSGGESISDRRKRRSYLVEQLWYQKGAPLCHRDCRVAAPLAVRHGTFLLLEDLQAAGFAPNPHPGERETRGGLRWLAHFHARFLGVSIPGLWEEGCYWHLSTRQEEWQRMPDGPLKEHAHRLDARLKQARYQTLVHGDAKTTNFCWSLDGSAAAVDFQYVGRGCGIRDVALFLRRSLGGDGRGGFDERWLDFYFRELALALAENGYGHLTEEVVEEWRSLYPVAWSDYCRFSLGWSERATLDTYSQKLLRLALRGG